MSEICFRAKYVDSKSAYIYVNQKILAEDWRRALELALSIAKNRQLVSLQLEGKDCIYE